MLLAQRQERIIEELADGGLTVTDLAASLGVSESTVRRDLDALARAGRLTRAYGGAMLTRGSRESVTDTGAREHPLSSDARTDGPLRERVAAAAAALVVPGSVVALDIGATTPLVARALRGLGVTIITSSLAVLDEVRDDEATELVLLGGVLRRNQQSLVGPIPEQIVPRISADLMLLTCTGVRGSRVLDNMAVETPIKQALVAASDRIVLLASEQKFPGTGTLQLCEAADVDVLVTTSQTSEDALAPFREHARVVVA